ncbi:hypothetical protein B0H15DRAFT_738799, partial [Mycena belliarum]
LIGVLQKINTNNQVGGELEASILKTFMRGAHLRRWLNREDCPEVIRQFKRIFDLAFTRRNFRAEDDSVPGQDREKAHFIFKGVNYSRAKTHLGNSLVIYYPPGSTESVPGSIEKILVENNTATFLIRHQAPLPVGSVDPFKPFVHFPAKTYSSKMLSGELDKVNPSSVLSHCARFEFSNDRAVILNLSR